MARTTEKSHDLLQIIRDDGLRDRTLEPSLTDAQLKELYKWMLLVRVLDQRMLNLQRQGRIGFYGTVTGEEAAVIGSAYALKKEDWILPALRQGGAALMRGFPLSLYIAQCIGNSLDVQKGRQMPCHYGYKPANFVAWSSNIATQLPHAVGVAYAAKVKKDPIVVMAYLGDGATSEGDFHVAANMAGVWKAPVVFLCQNNQWAISVPFSQQTAAESIAIKATAYGFQGVRVDGNDVLAVYKAAQTAVDRARAGEGPTLVEAVTYRIGAHSSSDDPSRYRSEEEVERWRKRDPIDRYKNYLRQRGLWSQNFESQLQEELNAQISLAITEAEAAPALTVDSLFEDVYAQMPWHLREQLENLKKTR
ncbi:pyruvate dehydrogenase (acetyl-transferring) E1 component subunit alpha [Candidatus Acetothermia bacterium]|nr:pyruvate dehydrogenase (acetyl-transferring) E1 component subunit alpha [Candidatus Acetothermia bacterium]